MREEAVGTGIRSGWIGGEKGTSWLSELQTVGGDWGEESEEEEEEELLLLNGNPSVPIPIMYRNLG